MLISKPRAQLRTLPQCFNVRIESLTTRWRMPTARRDPGVPSAGAPQRNNQTRDALGTQSNASLGRQRARATNRIANNDTTKPRLIPATLNATLLRMDRCLRMRRRLSPGRPQGQALLFGLRFNDAVRNPYRS
jgi:hypothetical protein